MTDSTSNCIKVGSRKSELALIQTNCVIEKLKDIYPNKTFEIVTKSTLGDQILDKPLSKIGEKSLFTKELETALINKEVDLVVHSLKDMPTSVPNHLAIGAITKREDPRDALILHPKHRGLNLSSLPENSIIGTSSLRRVSQLKRNFPHLSPSSIRGNLQTRLRKLDEGSYDGIVLAVAGIMRMGWEHRISQILDESEMLYAVGQGALAVECRHKDCPMFSALNDPETAYRTTAERSLLSALGAGCSAPIAVSSELKDKKLLVTAAVWSLDGSRTLKCSQSITFTSSYECSNDELFCGFSYSGVDQQYLEQSYKLGQHLAQSLIDQGAMTIINEAKDENEKS